MALNDIEEAKQNIDAIIKQHKASFLIKVSEQCRQSLLGELCESAGQEGKAEASNGGEIKIK